MTLQAKDIAQQLLDFYQDDPARWTRRALARDKWQNMTNPLSPDAASWCLVGALKCTQPMHTQLAAYTLSQALSGQLLLFVNDECASFDEIAAILHNIVQQC